MFRAKTPERKAKLSAQLECPPLPPECGYLWRVFMRLHRRRGSNGFGPNPISWVDIDAFTRNAHFVLTPWEVEIIEMLDDVFRVEYQRARGESKDDIS